MSENIHDLLAGRGKPGDIPRVLEAAIAQDATHVEDEIEVVVTVFDRVHHWGPAPFMPRVADDGSVVLPNQGDRAIIGLAETDEPGTPEIWILAWTPAG